MPKILNTSRGAFDLRWEDIDANQHERTIVPAATFDGDNGPMKAPGVAEISNLLLEKQGAFIAAYSALSIVADPPPPAPEPPATPPPEAPAPEAPPAPKGKAK